MAAERTSQLGVTSAGPTPADQRVGAGSWPGRRDLLGPGHGKQRRPFPDCLKQEATDCNPGR